MDLLRCQDKQKHWGLDYTNILQLWRGGSIIAASHVIDVLDSMYRRLDHAPEDVLSNEEVSKKLERHLSDVKQVVVKAVEADDRNSSRPSARVWSSSSTQPRRTCQHSSRRRSWITLVSICVIGRGVAWEARDWWVVRTLSGNRPRERLIKRRSSLDDRTCKT
jgi:hypothetical protein